MLLRHLVPDIPVIQAPMAGVSTPTLAAAVSEAGGFGSLGIGAMSPETARVAISETRCLTRRPFGVNVFCHRSVPPDPTCNQRWLAWLRPEFARYKAEPPATLHEIYPSFRDDSAICDMLIKERPALVSFHFGLPDHAMISALRGADILLAATVTAPAEARQATEAGIDFLIAQGYEAGGHRGLSDPQAEDLRLDTLTLLRRIAACTPLPLIAAGGIMNGADIVAALKAGAAAVQMGTAFVACDESAASPAHRAALSAAGQSGTAMMSAISGRPARGIINRFTSLDVRPDRPVIPAYPCAYEAGKALDRAARACGETGYGAFWAGSNAGRVRPMPAARLMALLSDEIRETE
ncbi:NAD(P)H-dependent flavin oxidoreductase [Acetobacter fallax]|uniref:Propionate 3-nitronate monooxygenase n=1 Tax=Acetobacter fallax TaxID=1737473 RepID=A0ABX0KFI0_9PROT|nr:nitronate monooxygenase [Acetobacter fallax]NHO32687.1 nitronate monooxygenase [Acetobacter fallax]NHO36253.1 nitronate monooxygenase [Acetobacter fallax]